MADLNFHTVCGVGNYSLVWVCTHKTSGEVCCVKQLKRSVIYQASRLEQISNEKYILQVLSHPGILKLYNTGNDLTNLYFIFDYIPGGSIQFYLRKFHKFEENVVAFYAAEIISVLDYMFRRGVVYRNLNSESVLLDEAGHVKLVGFSNAKIIQERTYTLCGQPEYLAPEIVKGVGYNQSSDWWSLGILLFEMLVGTTPFKHDNLESLFEMICDGESLQYPSFLSEQATNFLQQLIKVDPEQRMSSLHGRKSVTSHPWFREIQWLQIETRSAVPPLVPTLESKVDASNYTPEDNFEKIQEWHNAESVSIPIDVQKFFDEF